MHPLEQKLGYQFRDPSLLTHALTHPSTAKTFAGGAYNNQRLEFLGDAVLGLCISELLYGMYPAEAEGDLSKRHVALVNGVQLAKVAESLGLGEHMILSQSEEDAGGKALQSNLEDACEALLGAMFLDGGLEAVRVLIETYWKPLAKTNVAPPKDPKTALQEWAQGRGLPLPEYRVVGESGPAHAPHFTIEVKVKGKSPVQAAAGTKKLAERLAAEALLADIGDA